MYLAEMTESELETEFLVTLVARNRQVASLKRYCDVKVSQSNVDYIKLVTNCKHSLEQVADRLAEIRIRRPQLRDEHSETIDQQVDAVYTEFMAGIIPTNIVKTEPLPTHYRLPSVSIPLFSGELEDWAEFNELFYSVVHSNTEINNIYKFQILKGALQGRALDLVKGIPITDEGYIPTYKRLKEAYENDQRLASYHFNGLAQVTPLQTASVTEIQTLLSQVNSATAGLAAARIPNLADYLQVKLILAKLDATNREAYEQSLPNNEFPTVKTLTQYLTKRMHVLENTASTSPLPARKSTARRPTYVTATITTAAPAEQKTASRPTSPKNRPTYATVVKSPPPSPPQSWVSDEDFQERQLGARPKVHRQVRYDNRPRPAPKERTGRWCEYCQTGTHNIHQCASFRRLGATEKYETVKYKLRLCFVCLGKHYIGECKAEICCEICDSHRHNALLHGYYAMKPAYRQVMLQAPPNRARPLSPFKPSRSPPPGEGSIFK
jgi:hypothetical protein